MASVEGGRDAAGFPQHRPAAIAPSGETAETRNYSGYLRFRRSRSAAASRSSWSGVGTEVVDGVVVVD